MEKKKKKELLNKIKIEKEKLLQDGFKIVGVFWLLLLKTLKQR